MSESEHSASHGYKGYWMIWVVLLVATVTMIFIGESQMSTALQVVLLLMGSSIKATLIIFFYMHLRFEKMGLTMIVMVGIFVTSLLMFAIPAYDGTQILERSLYK
jgi:cytochrome c oxidase subunit 4